MTATQGIILNKAQEEVVGHTEGPLLVVAGAGTGKTGVLVARINRLLNEGVPAKAVLAVTFTEKAAAEMLDRIAEARQHIETTLPIMTFNAFGESLLREFNTDIGLSRDFLVMGDNAKVVFLRQHLTELGLRYFSPISNPEGLLPDIADYFSQLKQHVITPNIYNQFVASMRVGDEADRLEKSKHEELARAYQAYIEISNRESVIDYDDQIYRVIELLKVRPNVLEILQSRYQHIMIDEFQDTNPMQSELIDLLYGAPSPSKPPIDTRSLVVVGDDDQSIYGFRGATLANILDFKERYPKTKEITLTENYRSTQAILDGAYQLIQNNNPYRLETRLNIRKRLHAQKTGPKPSCKQFSQLDLELDWLADDIKQRLKNGEEAGQIAVLCRRNATAKQLSERLSLADIDHTVIGERYQLYQTEVVRMLVEALRAVIDPAADVSLYHTLSSALFNIPIEQLAKLSARARRTYHSLSELIIDQTDEIYQPLKHAVELIAMWREQAGTTTVGRLVYKVIEESGYKDRLSNDALHYPEAALNISHLSNFFRTLKEFESIAIQPTAVQYLESFAVLEAAGESNEDGTLQVANDKVNILTIHKAKGLEWNTVYIADCTEGSFPLRARNGGISMPEDLIKSTSSEADEHFAEERRLMYVALTRARQNLVLSYSKRHFSPIERKPSRFITEIFGTVSADNGNETAPTQARLDLVAPALYTPTPVTVPRTIYDGKTFNFSASQVTTFLNCPLDFYYYYVLNVPQAPKASAAYGTAIHAVIETVNNALKNQQDLALEDVITAFEQAWNIEGYISKDHAETAHEQALQTIQNFYEQHFLGDKIIPTEVESEFSVPLPGTTIRLRGRFDAVFENENGAEIRDYKTSSTVDTPEKAKRRTSSSDQLTIYALVWRELHGELPAKLSLEFVDTGMFGEVKKTIRGIETMRQKIIYMSEAIAKNEFKPGSKHDYCRHPQLS